MYFEEKIEQLKKEFSTADFKVPFTQGSEILKKIERKFIYQKGLNPDLNNLSQYFNYWPENLKGAVEVECIEWKNINSWINKFDNESNFWMVLGFGNPFSNKHLVFDCKTNAIAALFSIHQNDFFIVEKKYQWLFYVQIDRKTQFAKIYKTGDIILRIAEKN